MILECLGVSNLNLNTRDYNNDHSFVATMLLESRGNKLGEVKQDLPECQGTSEPNVLQHLKK